MNPQQWLNIIKQNPIAFGLENGFKDLTDMHNDWIKSFLFEERDQTLQAHRGSYKTTCLSIAIAVMVVVYLDKSIILFRKTDDDIKEIVSQVKKLLYSAMMQQMAVDLYGKKLYLNKDSVSEINTSLYQGKRGSSQLVALGIKSSITGKHGDIIITDDIVNLEDRQSKAERNRTKRVYQELQNIKNPGGRFINTGTPWHIEDCFTLMPNIRKFDINDTGMLSHEQIQTLRKNMTPSLFAANYELLHIADEEQLFTAPIIDDGSHSDLIYDGVCHVDAAYGGDDGTAFTIAKERGDKIYVFGKLWKKHVDDVLSDIEGYRSIYRAGTLYNENNADKGYLLKQVKRPRIGYHEDTNKFIKISTFLRRHWQDIIFIKETDDEYIRQILDYTENAEHDDAPDSLASLIRVMKKGGKMQTLSRRELGI